MALTDIRMDMIDDSHDGHRQRMKNRAWEEGLTALAPHEVIELLLYYGIPRHDMNQVAHRLIDAFGSVQGVLSAEYEELIQIPGVGDRAARTLNAFSRAVHAYRRLKDQNVWQIVSRKDAVMYANDLFENDRRVQTWIALVNSSGVVAFERRLRTGAMWYNERIRQYIAERALLYDAHEVIIISRRGMDMPLPLLSDRRALIELAVSLEKIDVYIMDYIVVGRTKTISMRQVADIGLSRMESRNKAEVLSENWRSDDDGVIEVNEIPEEF